MDKIKGSCGKEPRDSMCCTCIKDCKNWTIWDRQNKNRTPFRNTPQGQTITSKLILYINLKEK